MKGKDNMKQPAMILVLPVLYTILVLPVFLPVSAILEDIGHCRYWKILENTGYTSIADTGRFWKILVIPVLQILEDSRKYWLYQYYRYWKIRYEVAECTCILFFFVLSVMRELRLCPLMSNCQSNA
jgi:hypothetical protein